MSSKMKLFSFLDQDVCEVSTGKRVFAYIIDWFCSALCLMLPLCLVWMYKTQDLDGMSKVNLYRLNDVIGTSSALLAGAAGLLLLFWYMVYIPWKVTPGQTPGKRTMGFKIARKDGQALSLKDLLVRQIVGLVIIEGILSSGSSMIRDMLSLSTGLNLGGVLYWIALIATIVSILFALFSPSRRMLHDYLAKTTLETVPFEREDESI